MYAAVRARMAQQHGLVTRPQALAAGVPAAHLARLVRAGTWVAVRRGVYAEAAVVAATTSHRDRRLLADRAASLRIGRPHVMSHESAAYELDMAILRPELEVTHVTRPGVVGSHLRHGVKHHLAPFPEMQVVEVAGRRVLDRARTAIDIAREHGNPAGVVAVDAARRHGVTLERLWGVVDPAMDNWPYAVERRAAIDDSDGDSDSIGETLSRLLVEELGHGRPRTQFGLTRDGRVAWCDLRLDRHLIEFDGRVKYLREDEGGVATSSPSEVVWREKKRQDWLVGFRLGMSRLVWDDLFGAARERALARVDREYLQTCQLFGTDISDLTPFLARGPRPRPGARTPAA